MSIGERLKHAWNSFVSNESAPNSTFGGGGLNTYTVGATSTTRPDRLRPRIQTERTIIASIYTRLAVDVAAARLEHVKVETETEMYLETVKSGLNDCLKVKANADQFGRHFRQDMAWSLFTEGCIAIIPVDTNMDPNMTAGFDIKSMRVGVILQWWPAQVKVRAYNEKTGQHEDLILPKTLVAIVENPFYEVMNQPNSTLQRLIHKLALLDHVDEISSSGKLDIIVQLPYQTRAETRQNQAKKRVTDIKEQLTDSTYGIAYVDANEKIIQLNRAVENNLLEQVKFLKTEVYSELGLSEGVMNGTAPPSEMTNYQNRTIEPVLDALTEAMTGTFFTKTARTQGHTMMYFQSPFKYLTIEQLAEIADVLSRNQIVTPNELRPVLGLKPSKETQANTLVNSNMPLDQQVTDDGAPAELEALDPADAEEAELDGQMAELGLV